MTDKQMLRETFLAARNDITPAVRSAANERVCSDVLDWLQSAKWSQHAVLPASGDVRPAIGLYHAVRSEVDVASLIPALRQAGWRTAYPKTDRATRHMEYVEVREETTWTHGAYGILEPDAATDRAVIDNGALTVLLIPGVAFDVHGVRLGYGGGYFDRFLSQPGVRALRVGVAYSAQVIDELPADAHDMRMDYLVTEQGVALCETSA